MGEMEGLHFVEFAMAWETLWCSPLDLEHVRVLIALTVQPKVQVLGVVVVLELETMYSKVAVVVVAGEGAVASQAVVEIGLEPVGPMVPVVVLGYALAPRNAWVAGHGLEAAGPMLFGLGLEQVLGQVLEPMDLKVLEVEFGPLASKVVGLGVAAEKEAKHSFDPAAAEAEAAEAELKARVVVAVPGAVLGAMVVVEKDY